MATITVDRDDLKALLNDYAQFCEDYAWERESDLEGDDAVTPDHVAHAAFHRLRAAAPRDPGDTFPKRQPTGPFSGQFGVIEWNEEGKTVRVTLSSQEPEKE